MRAVPFLLLALAVPLSAVGQESRSWPEERRGLEQQVSELKGQRATWRGVDWNRCLLDGFREARERNKPLLVWALGGDPTGRC